MSSFKIINGVNYAIDETVEAGLHSEVTKVINGWVTTVECYRSGLVKEMVKEAVAFRVASLVREELGEPLAKAGFLTIAMATSGGYRVSVGFINDELVFGVLVK